ncbi:MAG: hypothetical protein M1472_02670 [Planctomycetes bacterium]|jgi:hypothetical protein|nr:hypothetical protein [Planctomycetota bacterium]
MPKGHSSGGFGVPQSVGATLVVRASSLPSRLIVHGYEMILFLVITH